MLARGIAWGESAPLFVDDSARSGLASMAYENGARGRLELLALMGPGAAFFDYDGDGDLDLFLPQGGTLPSDADAATTTAPASGGGRLLRNDLQVEGGSLVARFVDVTARAGLRPGGYGVAAAVGDYDGDGAPDLFVGNIGGNRLWRNRGDGAFVEETPDPLRRPGWTSGASFFDADGDGDLDLYVVDYVEPVPGVHCFAESSRPDYCGPAAYKPLPDRLLRNDGAADGGGAVRWTDLSAQRRHRRRRRSRAGRGGERRRRRRPPRPLRRQRRAAELPLAQPGQRRASSRRASSPAPRCRATVWPAPAWASRRATSTATVTRSCSSPTSPARGARSTSTTARRSPEQPAVRGPHRRGGPLRSQQAVDGVRHRLLRRRPRRLAGRAGGQRRGAARRRRPRDGRHGRRRDAARAADAALPQPGPRPLRSRAAGDGRRGGERATRRPRPRRGRCRQRRRCGRRRGAQRRRAAAVARPGSRRGRVARRRRPARASPMRRGWRGRRSRHRHGAGIGAAAATPPAAPRRQLRLGARSARGRGRRHRDPRRRGAARRRTTTVRWNAPAPRSYLLWCPEARVR